MPTRRRDLLLATAASSPLALLAQSAPKPGAIHVPAGQDRHGTPHTIGVSTASFKVSTADTQGGLFLMEHKHTRKGGPARHLHRAEDEWFYVLEGSYLVEAAGVQSTFGPGDSILVPRMTSHAFAFIGDAIGRLLVAFTPAGKMEQSFLAFDQRKGAYSRWDDPAARAHALTFGVEVLGPPLTF